MAATEAAGLEMLSLEEGGGGANGDPRSGSEPRATTERTPEPAQPNSDGESLPPNVRSRGGILKKHPSYDEAVQHQVGFQAAENEEGENQQKKEGLRKRKKQNKEKPVPFWRLFRFSTWLDWLMIVFGLFSSIVTGVALPAHFILFGRVLNEFVFFTTAIGFAPTVIGNASCTIVVAVLRNNSTLLSAITSNSSAAPLCSSNQSDSSAMITNILDYLCEPGPTLLSRVGVYSGIYAGMATGLLVIVFVGNLFWSVSAYKQSRRMRVAFYSSIIRQEIGWFDVNETAQLNTRLQDDIGKIQSGIGDKLSVFLQYVSTFISGFVIAFIYSWKLALVTATMLPLIALLAGTIARIVATFSLREQKAYATAGAVAEEVISSIRTVAALGGEAKEVERYGEHLKSARNEGIKKGFLTSVVTGGLYVVIFSTYALGFWYGSTLVIGCEVDPGDIITVFFSVIIGCFSLGNALPEIETFATARASAAIVYATIDRKPIIDSSSSKGAVLDNLEGNIEFSDVVFHYPARPDIQILNGLDLQVSRGQTVALVGPSGCGKSTVIQLIQRFYNPIAGLITVDGVKIDTLNLQWLRDSIGIVSQEPILFNTTIAENIRYGKEDATEEEIEQAARNANAYDFIMKLPQGFDSLVGDRGSQMSGGQKQRIAIARALVKNPKILLLDEATSALDTESEKIVQDALDRARKGRTTIVIAHRLSTIQTADIIIGIRDGRVVEMGNHLELMDMEGLYYELVTAQTIAEKEEDSEEPLADFRAKVRLDSYRQRTRDQSVTSQASDRPPPVGRDSVSALSRQSSVRSRLSRQDSVRSEVGEVVDTRLVRLTFEDIPIVAGASAAPGRHGFVAPDTALYDEEEVQADGRVVTFEPAIACDEEPTPKKRRKQDWKDMLKIWKRKTHGEEEEGEEDEVIVSNWGLLKLNAPEWYLIVVGILGSGLIGALFPLLSILFSEVLRVFGLNNAEQIEDEIRVYALAFVGLAVGAGIVQFLASYSLSIAGEKLTKRMRYKSFKAIVRQNIGWFDEPANSTGALTTRLAVEASEVKGATGIRLGSVMQTVFGFIAAITIAFTASWELTLVLIIAFPIIGSVGYLQLRMIVNRSQKDKKNMEGSGQTAVESIENIRTVAALRLEERFFNSYLEQLNRPFRSNMINVFFQAVVFALAQSFIFYIYSIGMIFGAYLLIEGRTTYDQIFRVFGAVVFTALQLGRASSLAPDSTKGRISAGRILALLNREPIIDSYSEDGEKPESTTGDVAAVELHFHYPTRPNLTILRGLSVSVKSGQTLALVGPSGCGKSTIISLLERFYDPLSGSLKIDGEDVRDLNIKWLRSQIGLVSQEPVLFNKNIAENIRYGANFRNVSDEEVEEAAKSANIHSFIESLPQGYNTNVGAKGTQLSGGQKQRIAIARALVRNPKILLLDEATSALDTESEKIVQDALDRARVGRTTITIAHRLSTIYNADCIAVMHNGKVIESGTHQQLMELHGAYYHLNTVQMEDFDDESVDD